MPGKGGGFWDNPFGGLFDINGDGKEDLGEQFLAYKMFEEISKEDNSDALLDDEILSSIDEAEQDDSWRIYCEDGSEYGVDPDDYETEEEYEEALEDAKGVTLAGSTPHISKSCPHTQTHQNTAAISPNDSSGSESLVGKMPVENKKKVLTPDEYRSKRSQTYRSTILIALAVMLTCAIPCVLIWAAISTYDDNNNAGWLVTLIIAGEGIALLCFILKVGFSVVTENIKEWHDTKREYILAMSDEDKTAFDKREKKRTIVCAICAFIAVLAVIIPVSIGHIQVSHTYSMAEDLIQSQNYEEAKELLEQIEGKDYKDTSSLLLLCEAQMDYINDYPVKAYYAMKQAKFRYQTEEMNETIKQFKATLTDEYDRYISEMAERLEQEYEDRIRNGVPYVGMPESRINDTSLGKPSDKVRHNYQVKNGEQYLANLYDFYQDGKCVFTARCVQGTVTEVWDNRDNPQTPYIPNNSGGKTYDTGPSVDGFSDPEDFYDWYWDDFFDYEDAEDYYYEHGGK